MTPEELQKKQKAYRLFRIIQYVGPLVIIAIALLISKPGLFFAASDSMIRVLPPILCLVAVFEFFMFRFMIIPQLRKQLEQHKQD